MKIDRRRRKNDLVMFISFIDLLMGVIFIVITFYVVEMEYKLGIFRNATQYSETDFKTFFDKFEEDEIAQMLKMDVEKLKIIIRSTHSNTGLLGKLIDVIGNKGGGESTKPYSNKEEPLPIAKLIFNYNSSDPQQSYYVWTDMQPAFSELVKEYGQQVPTEYTQYTLEELKAYFLDGVFLKKRTVKGFRFNNKTKINEKTEEFYRTHKIYFLNRAEDYPSMNSIPFQKNISDISKGTYFHPVRYKN